MKDSRSWLQMSTFANSSKNNATYKEKKKKNGNRKAFCVTRKRHNWLKKQGADKVSSEKKNLE